MRLPLKATTFLKSERLFSVGEGGCYSFFVSKGHNIFEVTERLFAAGGMPQLVVSKGHGIFEVRERLFF